ncbi:hypothetical protein M9Y10_014686 [Tritrichomonas musculus]|uniref:Protein kinase domain-containing protein n=1 Tax=Tritrichomonas musculus TaxID=1915356 RepID=A0ABR2L070_9EUKA
MLQDFFSTNKNLTIYFLSNVKEIFNQKIQIPNKQIENDLVLKEEIKNFHKSFSFEKNYQISQSIQHLINQVWNKIKSCITGYLIKQSYDKLKNKKHINSKQRIEEYDESEFVELRKIGTGTFFNVFLIYNINKEELLALKKPLQNDGEIPKLLKRENSNYSMIDYQLIPKFHGFVKGTNYPIIEFINGKTLMNIRNFHFNKDEKYSIIFQLMMIINYLHNSKFIYRDLKPNNVMIDENKTVFLIDFDRMIKVSNETFNESHTNDFQHAFVAPEVNYEYISYGNDIYSLGQMIYYIINEKLPKTTNVSDDEFSNSNIQEIFNKCTKESIEDRPNIFDLMCEFYIIFKPKINFSFLQNDWDVQFINELSIYHYNSDSKHTSNLSSCYWLANKEKNSEAQYLLGIIYLNGEYIKQNIDKGIHYLLLAANQNNSKAQFDISFYYFEGKYIEKNINKGVKYMTLAANQNLAKAQFYLGIFYLLDEYSKDVKKAIHYLLLAANQNYPKAQHELGCIYFENKYIQRDINKAIIFLSLAAENNLIHSQYLLGYIYSRIEYDKQDKNKAIHYLSLAANQNHCEAQFYLGTMIYSQSEKDICDINKAIHYLSLASQQNNSKAQFNLGFIYYHDHNNYIKRDINKAIHYFTLASNNKEPQSHLILGNIYFEGIYVKQDINKAIRYYTLASENDIQEAQVFLGGLYFEGQYVQQNINKAIYYYSLAAKHNNGTAQYNLGYIYSECNYEYRDINKAFYYYSLAAKNNVPTALNYLGNFYLYDGFGNPDVNKAIHYYTLASNQNNALAHYNLGCLYLEGKHVPKNINKAIHYFLLAANKNHSNSQHNLGVIYFRGIGVQKDDKKAIHYFTLAANQNNKNSQFNLGLLYISGIFIPKDRKKGIYYLSLSSMNGYKDADFTLGYLYQKGKYVQREIQKSIHYYKEASSFNNQYAKNNLGIIYKKGYENEIPKNLGLAMAYFDEAIRQNNDLLSMYNLANIYIYEDGTNERIDSGILLLVKSFELGFLLSKELLCIILVKKCGFDLDNIKKELNNQIYQSNNLKSMILEMISSHGLIKYFSDYYIYKNVDLLYNIYKKPVLYENVMISKPKKQDKITKKEITAEFYEGFGIDI